MDDIHRMVGFHYTEPMTSRQKFKQLKALGKPNDVMIRPYYGVPLGVKTNIVRPTMAVIAVWEVDTSVYLLKIDCVDDDNANAFAHIMRDGDIDFAQKNCIILERHEP